MGDSGSDAGASIHASFRPLHTTEQPPGVCGRSNKSISFRLLGRREYAPAFMDCTDRIYHLTHSTDQSRTEGARDPLARGRQGAYMWSRSVSTSMTQKASVSVF